MQNTDWRESPGHDDAGIMTTIAPTELLAQLQWRYATKQFDPAKPVAAATWAALEEALILSPSSYGLQPYRFVVITDPAVKARLKPLSWGQSQLTDASHIVAFTILKGMGLAHIERFAARITEVRGTPADKLAPYQAMIVRDLVDGPRSRIIDEWATRQAYIALGNFMTACALVGVDACPLEGIEPAKWDAELGLTDHAVVVACAAGHRLDSDKYATTPKVRFAAADLIERR
jgi:nitroreductase